MNATDAANARIAAVLADPCTSFWLRDALLTAMERDCLNAMYDAIILSELLTARTKAILGEQS